MRSSILPVVLIASLAGLPAAAQTSSPRTLFETGKYQEVLDTVNGKGPDASQDDIYLAAYSLTRLDRRDEARAMFTRLGGGEQDAWTFIGRSAAAVVEGNRDAALQAANQAVALAPDNFRAQYQLGLVKSLQSDSEGAAAAFERATEIDGNDAYAHYFAGVNFSQLRRADKMSRHFRAFLTLAPSAPERQQVETIMKTLR